MIKTIVDLRGMKRFKKSPTEEVSNDLPDDVTKAANAGEIFRKMT